MNIIKFVKIFNFLYHFTELKLLSKCCLQLPSSACAIISELYSMIQFWYFFQAKEGFIIINNI